MNREEALYELTKGLDLIKLMTWEHGQLGNYTQEQVQEICDRWKELEVYIKENLGTGNCFQCGNNLVIKCENCGVSLCRYCRRYSGDGKDRELCNSCCDKEENLR